MNNIDCQYVCVLGYGWSGSSAVVDLLKEFEENWDPEVEFRILKDPHGVMDLEHTLVDQWDALNVDIAIRDFLDFATFLNIFTRQGVGSKHFYRHAPMLVRFNLYALFFRASKVMI